MTDETKDESEYDALDHFGICLDMIVNRNLQRFDTMCKGTLDEKTLNTFTKRCYEPLTIKDVIEVVAKKQKVSDKEQKVKRERKQKKHKRRAKKTKNVMSVKDAKEAVECVICLESISEVALVPCGHKCLCSTCAKPFVGDCPVCRSAVTSRLKIFQ